MTVVVFGVLLGTAYAVFRGLYANPTGRLQGPRQDRHPRARASFRWIKLSSQREGARGGGVGGVGHFGVSI